MTRQTILDMLTDSYWQRVAEERSQQAHGKRLYTRTALLRTWVGSPYYNHAANQISRSFYAHLAYTLTADQWGQTLAYFDGACAYCATWAEMQTFEHWHAHSLGYGFVVGNMIPACRKCNQSRNNRDPWRWASPYGAGSDMVKDGALARIVQWAVLHGDDPSAKLNMSVDERRAALMRDVPNAPRLSL